MKHLVMGILAHVDAGKTTLSEGLLYTAGSIRKAGRVDNKDAFLDNYDLERERGITIFSKQAEISFQDMRLTLLDTPGHIDFSAEMERTLAVLDYAILVISASDGVQAHTETLWTLLSQYQIPVFLFINKMDQPQTDREALLKELKEKFSEGCVDFSGEDEAIFWEELAVLEEQTLETFLEEGSLSKEEVCRLIRERKAFPCYFGSALKMTGVKELLQGILEYTKEPVYPTEFGARVFKIAREEEVRLTYLKVTGGSLRVREKLDDEKVTQLRMYSGERYRMVDEVSAGSICAVCGLTKTFAGEGLGIEKEDMNPVLEPVLTYRLILPEGYTPTMVLPKLRLLEEEDPKLHIVWQEALEEIQVELMGQVQLEVVERMILDRFGFLVSFGEGAIVYKETIGNTVEGVGHFEPLRHYAEVHLLLEPLKRGQGLIFATDCSEDMLDKNWQRLILTHLAEKEHRGVLTGSAITDMKITLVAGKAHQKHTEGGDFRQAVYRAVRQGLMAAESILLEPYYRFHLRMPQGLIGRGMTDLEKLGATMEAPVTDGDMAILTGIAPAATMTNYQQEVTAYTKGLGRLSLSFHGYEVCHNPQEVIALKGYEPERDLENPSSSVFCSHGAGFFVPWDEVWEYAHLERVWKKEEKQEVEAAFIHPKGEDEWLGTEEIDEIIEKTFYANRGERTVWKKRKKIRDSQPERVRTYRPQEVREPYLLVDGYNIIFAWEELCDLAKENMDGARGRLLDYMANYQGAKGCQVMVVFDAYRVEGHPTEVLKYHNIYVVYTKEAETADQYIEKFAHENAKKYAITVATSDGLEQVIIRGQGCQLLSANELLEELKDCQRLLRETYIDKPKTGRSFLLEGVSEKTKEELAFLGREKERENGANQSRTTK